MRPRAPAGRTLEHSTPPTVATSLVRWRPTRYSTLLPLCSATALRTHSALRDGEVGCEVRR